MATVTQRPVDAMATVGLVTRKSGRALGLVPALQSKWSEIGRERETGRESETAALTTSLQRNTNTSELLVTAAKGGRGLAHTRETERGSVATRANTTAAVGTQDMAVTGAKMQLTVKDWLSLALFTYSEPNQREFSPKPAIISHLNDAPSPHCHPLSIPLFSWVLHIKLWMLEKKLIYSVKTDIDIHWQYVNALIYKSKPLSGKNEWLNVSFRKDVCTLGVWQVCCVFEQLCC